MSSGSTCPQATTSSIKKWKAIVPEIICITAQSENPTTPSLSDTDKSPVIQEHLFFISILKAGFPVSLFSLTFVSVCTHLPTSSRAEGTGSTPPPPPPPPPPSPVRSRRRQEGAHPAHPGLLTEEDGHPTNPLFPPGRAPRPRAPAAERPRCSQEAGPPERGPVSPRRARPPPLPPHPQRPAPLTARQGRARPAAGASAPPTTLPRGGRPRPGGPPALTVRRHGRGGGPASRARCPMAAEPRGRSETGRRPGPPPPPAGRGRADPHGASPPRCGEGVRGVCVCVCEGSPGATGRSRPAASPGQRRGPGRAVPGTRGRKA